MRDILIDLTDAYPELLTLDVMGQSREGRDIWIVTVNNPSTGEHSSKPAMYIDAIHMVMRYREVKFQFLQFITW